MTDNGNRGGARRLIKPMLLGAGLVLAAASVSGGTRATEGLVADSYSEGQFSPSNARTQDGKLIPVEQFFPSSRCARCHADTHSGWSQSLHRNAAREPFYRESVDILLQTRGIEPTRHCESCHTPVALFSGALTKESPLERAPFTALDDEGVTCSVCHSITEARLDGTGSYTIRRPALLAKEDGTPVYGDVTDEQILADVPGHKRAVMRPLMRTPELCSVCHKVDAPAELNAYKHVRGFSAYDEWQQSGASRESVLPFYSRESRAECRTCHMPKVESLNDRAAKNGMIASHRWPGANTAVPLLYGQGSQRELIENFLKSNVLSVDIFGLRRARADQMTAPLAASGENAIDLRPGEALTAEVVVSNRNAAHTFPPEVRDLYEAWVQFEAFDASGRMIFKSGFIKPDGMLDESAHAYKTIILDKESRPITRHQIWLTNIKAYDNTILPGRSDVVRFGFRVRAGVSFPITLRARVNYRRFNQEYASYVSGRRGVRMPDPVVTMVEAETKVGQLTAETQRTPGLRGEETGPLNAARGHGSAAGGAQEPLETARRWNDYGIGLLEQRQYGPASNAFRRAAELDPDNPSLLVNTAIAEMRTERFGPERAQWAKAASLLESALRLDPRNARARFYQALVLRGMGKLKQAADELALIAAAYPRDREVQRQYGQTLYSLGRFVEARAAFESVIAVDPTDAPAYALLGPLYRMEGHGLDADRAEALYRQWRDDPVADGIAARFFAAHPEWSDERITSHVHGGESPDRPILSGSLAAPVK